MKYTNILTPQFTEMVKKEVKRAEIKGKDVIFYKYEGRPFIVKGTNEDAAKMLYSRVQECLEKQHEDNI